jgi:hypothetical protein
MPPVRHSARIIYSRVGPLHRRSLEENPRCHFGLTDKGDHYQRIFRIKANGSSNDVYFYIDPKTASHPDYLKKLPLNEGEWCFSINSATLSRAFGIGSHEIFACNRRRTLLLVGVDDTLSRAGVTDARRYTFQIGEQQASITIEGDGSA